jgi:hypothetical protein
VEKPLKLISFIVFTADRPPSLFLRAAQAHSAGPGGQNALGCSEMHCLKMHFAHQAQLNAHVRPLETKMAVDREKNG